MYTVVSCPDCKENAWIVKDTPDRSRCGKCGHNRQFKRLKHYHQTDDVEEARLVLAEVTAKLNGQGDAFKDAFEKGIITEEPDTNLREQIPDDLGVTEDELKDVDDRIMNSNSKTLSDKDAVLKGIEQNEPADFETVASFAEKHDVSEDDVDDLITRLLMEGNIYEVEDDVYKTV